MHYLAFVLIPSGGNPAEHVARLMEPHKEWYSEDSDESGGFWDWWQIGGRFTGRLSGYDPEQDPENVEACVQCRGTGFRSDALGQDARAAEPSYTCNGCGSFDHETGRWTHGPQGPGRRVAWPTHWQNHHGDVQPAAEVWRALQADPEQYPYRLVWDGGECGKEFYVPNPPDGEHFPENPEFRATVAERLARHEGSVAVVDYHC